MAQDIAPVINVVTVLVTAVATAIATWIGVRNRERERAQEHVNKAQTLLVTTLQATVDAQQESIARVQKELTDERAKSTRLEARVSDLEKALLDATLAQRQRRTAASS